MRLVAIPFLCAVLSARAVLAQAVVVGGVVLEEGGRPLEYTTVGIPAENRQFLTNETGRFTLAGLPAGQLRLRFKRIGYVPRDTTLMLAAGDTVRLRIEMSRLVIQLPEMLVSAKCTNETPREPVPGFLAELMDQVIQNSERMALLVAQRPFQIRTEHTNGLLDRNDVFTPTRVDTILRINPLPERPYKPREVMFPITEGPYKGATGVRRLELTDIADTAFTNNHCFRYAGRALIGADSVIQVEFVPVPWLDQEVDLSGTLYLEVDGYQIFGSFTRLSRIPPLDERAGLVEYYNEDRFTEIVPGVPVVASWELVNRYRQANRPRFVQRGRMIGIVWKDSTTSRP
jgi:hypothetical protein